MRSAISALCTALIDRIAVTTVAGLRDRALIGLMVFSFARIGAALGMKAARARRGKDFRHLCLLKSLVAHAEIGHPAAWPTAPHPRKPAPTRVPSSPPARVPVPLDQPAARVRACFGAAAAAIIPDDDGTLATARLAADAYARRATAANTRPLVVHGIWTPPRGRKRPRYPLPRVGAMAIDAGTVARIIQTRAARAGFDPGG